jgi:hypothetical protein
MPPVRHGRVVHAVSVAFRQFYQFTSRMVRGRDGNQAADAREDHHVMTRSSHVSDQLAFGHWRRFSMTSLMTGAAENALGQPA